MEAIFVFFNKKIAYNFKATGQISLRFYRVMCLYLVWIRHVSQTRRRWSGKMKRGIYSQRWQVPNSNIAVKYASYFFRKRRHVENHARQRGQVKLKDLTAWSEKSIPDLLSLPSLRVWVPASAGKAKAGIIPLADMRGCAGKTVRSLENTCHTWAP